MFHISRKMIGGKVKFTPRIPETQNASEAFYPPRVCAAPSIEQCLAGIEGTAIRWALESFENSKDAFYVYKLPNKGYKHGKDVSDYEVTKEVHYYSPVEGILVGEFVVIKQSGKFELTKLS